MGILTQAGIQLKLRLKVWVNFKIAFGYLLQFADKILKEQGIPD
jgi:hypothetical protein